MVDALTGTKAPLRIDTRKDEPGVVQLGNFLLSQSGMAMPEHFGEKHPTPLVPPGKYDHVEIMALDPAGVHRTAIYEIDAKGMLVPNTKNPPLGDLPFRLTLVDKDGGRFSGNVDISPGKIKVKHSGYETISGLKLTKEAPPKPPPPGEVTLGSFMLSQSGNALPENYAAKNQTPLVPPGQYDHVEIMALDPAGVHRTATYEIDAKGMLVPNTRNPPLGDLPFRLTLVDKDGNRFQGDVDISPRKIKVKHSGYETVEHLKLKLVSPADANPEAMNGVAGDFLKKTSQSPTGNMTIADVLLRRS